MAIELAPAFPYTAPISSFYSAKGARDLYVQRQIRSTIVAHLRGAGILSIT